MISLILALSLNAQAMNLDQYKWKNRLLILKGSPETELYKNALAILEKNKSDLLERKLTIIQVKSSDSFSLELRGLDGGVKLQAQRLELEKIFKLIDSMPMRQQESKKSQPRMP